jgi:4-hydroxymandelate oxidase
MKPPFPHDLAGFAAAAHERLDPAIWAYLARGADDGASAEANVAAWRRLQLRPRVLRGVGAPLIATTVLGRPIAAPILVAPTGRATRFHPGGEAAVLEGVRTAGLGTVLASSVSSSLPALAARAPGALIWSQLYISSDRGHTAACAGRAEAAGCGALVLTVDLVPGGAPADLPPLARAEWEADADPEPEPLFAAASLDDLAWLCERTNLPVVVKGVLRGDDATACLSAGARGLVVSNHGGGQLDGAVPTAQALPEVVAAAQGRAEVYVDGGIRRGSDVVRALALGARAVLVGRPASWGLAVGGADGLAGVIMCLRADLERAMRLCGADALSAIGPDLVVEASSADRPAPPRAPPS